MLRLLLLYNFNNYSYDKLQIILIFTITSIQKALCIHCQKLPPLERGTQTIFIQKQKYLLKNPFSVPFKKEKLNKPFPLINAQFKMPKEKKTSLRNRRRRRLIQLIRNWHNEGLVKVELHPHGIAHIL